MPELDGIEATRRIARRRPATTPTRVLMLTTFDLNEYVYEALRAGASGFLLKDVPPEQLAAGIRVVAEGRGAAGADDHQAPGRRSSPSPPRRTPRRRAASTSSPSARTRSSG